jgi:hypothetical protein
MEPLTIRNRTITTKDLKFIQAVVYENWDKGRTYISKVLCQKWNWLQPSGRIKYMAFTGDIPVACIGWGSAAWAVQSREEFVGWSKSVKNKNLHFIVNNTRYLVLPWVTVKCLASKVLALNIKRISSDWLKVYNYPLYMLETFVEQDRFKGTCYKASNWIRVGQTKGTSKKGHKHMKHGKIKDVYLYPLNKNFKRLMADGTS